MTDIFSQFFTSMNEDDTSTPEQKREAKDRIGKTMANLVVTKTAAELMATASKAITTGTVGEKSLGARCDMFAAECEAKLKRMAEGWDHNPTDTHFAVRRNDLVQCLTGVRDAAEQIRSMSDALLQTFDISPEGGQQ